MLSRVALLTIQYRRGDVSADAVVNALYTAQPPRRRSRLAHWFGPTSAELEEDPPPNTWQEVLRFWDALTLEQRVELKTARAARLNRDRARFARHRGPQPPLR